MLKLESGSECERFCLHSFAQQSIEANGNGIGIGIGRSKGRGECSIFIPRSSTQRSQRGNNPRKRGRRKGRQASRQTDTKKECSAARAAHNVLRHHKSQHKHARPRPARQADKGYTQHALLGGGVAIFTASHAPHGTIPQVVWIRVYV